MERTLVVSLVGPFLAGPLFVMWCQAPSLAILIVVGILFSVLNILIGHEEVARRDEARPS